MLLRAKHLDFLSNDKLKFYNQLLKESILN